MARRGEAAGVAEAELGTGTEAGQARRGRARVVGDGERVRAGVGRFGWFGCVWSWEARGAPAWCGLQGSQGARGWSWTRHGIRQPADVGVRR
jgi:hypothetical protein